MSISTPIIPGTKIRKRTSGMIPVRSLGESLLRNATFLNDVSPTFTNASGNRFNPFDKTFASANVRRRRPLYIGGGAKVNLDLIEGSRTNLCLQSQTLDNASWTKSNSSVTANTTTAPDGTITADSIIEDSSLASTHYVRADVIAAAGNLTFSIYLKANTRSTVLIYNDNAIAYARFSLSSGTVLSTSGSITAKIVDVDNGWFRCSISVTVGASGQSCYVFLENDTTTTYDGDGSSGVYAWGAQIEEASFPSTYIPTTTTAVTRNSDDLSVDLSGLTGGGLSTTEGTVVGIGVPNDRDLPSGISFDISHSGGGQFVIELSGGNAVLYRNNNIAPSFTEYNNKIGDIGLTWDSSNIKGYINGSLQATGASAAYSPVTSTYIGDITGLTRPYFGYVGLFYWDYALSAAEIKAVHNSLHL